MNKKRNNQRISMMGFGVEFLKDALMHVMGSIQLNSKEVTLSNMLNSSAFTHNEQVVMV